MSLFDLIKEQDGMGILPDGLSKQSTLFVTHIARGRPHKLCNGVLFLIFTHIVTVQGHAESQCQLARQFGLSHARWSHKQEGGYGFVGFAEPYA